jgi:hypothetical protein
MYDIRVPAVSGVHAPFECHSLFNVAVISFLWTTSIGNAWLMRTRLLNGISLKSLRSVLTITQVGFCFD